MGHAVLSLHLRAIADALQLPETHHLLSAAYDMRDQSLSFLVESDDIADTANDKPLPTMVLLVSVETGAAFRKTTVKPTILS